MAGDAKRCRRPRFAARGCSSAGPAATSATAARCSSDFAFHNVGVPQTGQYPPSTDDGRYDGIDGDGERLTNIFNRAGEFSDDQSDTNARSPAARSSRPDRTTGQFKTPTLRNVAQTAPYMHDGVYPTLWDVVDHYNFGGCTGPYSGTKDPAIAPLLLTDAELGDLVAFLRALDDGAPPTSDATTFARGGLSCDAVATAVVTRRGASF